MRKQAGFTLIELLVGMLVTMLIMGALVSLFSNAVQSEMSGFKQQEVYAQARAMMNDLKTTLRYADGAAVFYDTSNNKISSPTYDNTKIASKVEYTATIYNSSAAKNESVEITVEWLPNSNKKLLRIGRSIDGVAQPDEQFPKDISNSVFKGDGSDFPITVNKDDSSLYHINLSYKYKFALSGDKTDALITDVLKGAVSSTSGTGFPPLLITGGSGSGGNLEFNNSAKINIEGDYTLVMKFQNINGKLNSSSKFDVLTNNSSIDDKSNHINIVDYYEYEDQKYNLDQTIDKFSRIERYVIPSSNGSAGDTSIPIVFNNNEMKTNINNIALSGQNKVLMTINGINGVFAQNNISINAGNKNFASIALADGKDTGALIIYSDNKVTLDGVYIPKEIAVLIVTKNNDVTIKDSTIENGIIMTKGSKITIEKSTVYGMIEYGGNNAFDINGNCTFGSFQGQPTAIEVFDDYFGYNG
ncbi:MAG: prepilin-type N-terminal cleavage/methylation domain-containing protein [Acidaminococcaceae bacterium]